jgi:hypothetical protein
VGLLSGSYPAILISSFLPVFGLKKQILRGQRGRFLRNTLVVFQFAVSIGLIICALVVQQQLGFIKNQDVGYVKDQIVVIRLNDQNVKKSLDALKSELRTNPDVMAVTATDTLPNNIQSQTGPRWPGMPEDFGYFDIYISYVDDEYLDVYGIDLVQGRNFSQEFPSDAQSAFIFNETLAKALNWEQLLGREFQSWDGETGRIVGVIKDFNFHSLHRHIDPMYLYYQKEQNWVFYLSAKIRGGHIPETLGFIEKTWKKFSPAYPLDYSFFDEIFGLFGVVRFGGFYSRAAHQRNRRAESPGSIKKKHLCAFVQRVHKMGVDLEYIRVAYRLPGHEQMAPEFRIQSPPCCLDFCPRHSSDYDRRSRNSDDTNLKSRTHQSCRCPQVRIRNSQEFSSFIDCFDGVWYIQTF